MATEKEDKELMHDLIDDQEPNSAELDNDDSIDEEEPEEGTYEDLLPRKINVTKKIEAIVISNRTGKPVKFNFVIKVGGLGLDKVRKGQKKLYEINRNGTTNMDLIGHILSIWSTIVTKQPTFFKEDLKRYAKGEKTHLDGELIAEILIQVWQAHRNIEQYDDGEQQLKN